MTTAEKIYNAVILLLGIFVVLMMAAVIFIVLPQTEEKGPFYFTLTIEAILAIAFLVTPILNYAHRDLLLVPTLFQILFSALMFVSIPIAIWGVVLLVLRHRRKKRQAEDDNLDISSSPRALLKAAATVMCGFLAAAGIAFSVLIMSPDPYRVDLSEYENDLSEQAFRYLLANGPPSDTFSSTCIVFGHKITSPNPAFIARFADHPIHVVSLEAVEFSMEDPVFRQSLTGEEVVLLQVVNLPPSADGHPRIEAAWTYQGDEERKAYVVQRQGEQFTFTPERDIK